MTVISDSLEDIGYDKPNDVDRIVFMSKTVRDSAAGTEVIVKSRHVVYLNTNGSFTTDNLDPGPATVSWANERYDILIPDHPTPIRLGPLLDAVLPDPPPVGALFVRNAGNAARAIVMSAAEYATLVSTSTPDPDTIFFIYS